MNEIRIQPFKMLSAYHAAGEYVIEGWNATERLN